MTLTPQETALINLFRAYPDDVKLLLSLDSSSIGILEDDCIAAQSAYASGDRTNMHLYAAEYRFDCARRELIDMIEGANLAKAAE